MSTSHKATVRWLDLAVAGFISVLATLVWLETSTWFEARNLAQDPTLLPRAIAVLLWLCALGLVARNVRVLLGSRLSSRLANEEPLETNLGDEAGPGERREDEGAPGEEVSLTVALVSIVGVCLYAWVAFNLGWGVTTWVFLVGGVLLLGRGSCSPGRLAVIALVAAAVVGIVWFGFVDLLNVRMSPTMLP